MPWSIATSFLILNRFSNPLTPLHNPTFLCQGLILLSSLSIVSTVVSVAPVNLVLRVLLLVRIMFFGKRI